MPPTPTPTEVLKRIADLEAAGIKNGAEWFNAWADYWRYVIGANTIPCIYRKKKPAKGWEDWQYKPIPEELYNEWKAEGLFCGGIIVIAGRVWHNPEKEGLYLELVDADNLKAITEICTVDEKGTATVEQLAKWTLVERHSDDPNRLHIYVYSTKPFPKKSSDNNSPLADKIDANEIPAFEVKGEGGHGYHVVTPSIHESGHPYQIIGTKEPVVFDDMVKHIDKILAKYEIPYLSEVSGASNTSGNKAQIPIEDLFKEDFEIHQGHNRSEALLRYMESLIARTGINGILTLEQIKNHAYEWNQKHCKPPLDDTKFKEQWKWATKFIARKKAEEERKEAKRKEELRKWVVQYRQNNNNNNSNESSAAETTVESESESKQPTQRTELEGRLKKLTQTYRKLDGLVTPEFLKQFYNIKTTRPDKEIFYFDKDKGVYLPDGEIVIEQELEGMNDKLTVLYNEIVMVLDELYANIKDEQKRNEKIYEKLRAESIVRPKVWRKREIDEVRYHIERQTYFYRSNFNPNIEWLACEDCMINLLTGETAEFHPKYLNTTYIPVKYHVYKPNPFARINKEYCSCPEIMKFLNGIMEPDDVEITLDFIAYCLWREYKFHNWLLLNGAGQNGKSTLLRLITRFLGNHNVSGESLQRILERDFASAQLYGRLANIDADLSTESLKNTGLLKKLTGGDKLTAEFKNKQIFEFTNYAKLIFSANQIPVSEDMTDAFFRRPIIINLTRQFFEDADLNIDKKITTEAELSGLLRVCLQRLPRVLRNGIRQTTNESIKKTQEQYLRSANPIEYFRQKALNRNPNEKTPKDTVYESYKRFCKHFKLPVESEQAFSRKLTEEYGYEYKQFRDKSKGKNVYYWLGLKVSDWLAIEDKNQKGLDLEELTDTPPEDQPND